MKPGKLQPSILRALMLASQEEGVSRITVTVAEEVAHYVNNRKRRELARLEDEAQVVVQVFSREGVAPEHLAIQCIDANGREIRFALE